MGQGTLKMTKKRKIKSPQKRNVKGCKKGGQATDDKININKLQDISNNILKLLPDIDKLFRLIDNKILNRRIYVQDSSACKMLEDVLKKCNTNNEIINHTLNELRKIGCELKNGQNKWLGENVKILPVRKNIKLIYTLRSRASVIYKYIIPFVKNYASDNINSDEFHHINELYNIQIKITELELSKNSTSELQNQINELQNQINELEQKKQALITNKQSLINKIFKQKDTTKQHDASNKSTNTYCYFLHNRLALLYSYLSNFSELLEKYIQVLKNQKPHSSTSIVVPNKASTSNVVSNKAIGPSPNFSITHQQRPHQNQLHQQSQYLQQTYQTYQPREQSQYIQQPSYTPSSVAKMQMIPIHQNANRQQGVIEI
jgi:hypothetical protein